MSYHLSNRVMIALLLSSCLAVPLTAQPAADPAGHTIFDSVPAEARARYEADAVRLWDGRAPGAQGDTPQDIPLLYPLPPANLTNDSTP
jgi:hypothetical protein